MELGFLFWVFLAGFIIASIQDVRRREVDNWLNLVSFISGFSWVMFNAVFTSNASLIFVFAFVLTIVTIVSFIFYYANMYGGGDIKLLFAMTGFFIVPSFFDSLINVGIFIGLMFVVGSLYGLIYSVGLVFANYNKIKKDVSKSFNKIYFKILFVCGFIVLLCGFFDVIFIFLGIIFFVFPILIVFAILIEKKIMIKVVNAKDLKEGDVLVADIGVGGKTICSSWGGLEISEVKMLKKLTRKIKIKDGLPYVPGMFLSFLIYVFFREWIINFFKVFWV